ncbi:tetratricopeptide repeat protein [Oscillatoria sp. FACHB-1407]|uniref:tetratricopeptide repeat protein n=1 Tax=Oscillatoria sp. FACHB-1407 TaxID=2692847 RepID=UPI001686764F|nr:tetratricopeptide repeat protein [Oscillatoria sp. FACHB-1407]MBD2461156.1 tetratricopeptide repeat protein [Oscillatoria sp. FACHB-1407]
MCPQHLISLLTHAPAIALAVLLRSFRPCFTLTRNCRVEADCLQKQGWQYYEQRCWTEAERLFQQALVLRRAIGDGVGMTEILLILGLMAYQQREFVKAIHYYQQAFKLSKATCYIAGMGVSASHIGLIYRQLERHSWALVAYQHALKAFAEADDYLAVGQTLQNLAMTYADLGQLNQAQQYYKLSSQLLQEIVDPVEAVTHNELSLHQPIPSSTLTTMLQTTMQNSPDLPNGSSIALPLNAVNASANDLQESLETYKSLDDLHREAVNLHTVAAIYERDGLYLSALAHEEQALAIFQLLGDQVAIDETFHNLGKLHERLGHRKAAMRCYERVLGNLFKAMPDAPNVVNV